MKKKTTLAFSELAETLAVFDKKELSAIKGGLADASVEWQEDANGNLYYRNGSNDSWHEYSITLDTVNITGNGGGSNSSSAGISYGYGWGSSASGMGNSGYGGSDGSGNSGGGGSSVTYPLEASLFYNSSNNTFNLSLTTLADYWGDHFMQQLFSTMGTVSSQSWVSDIANDLSFSKSSLVRASVNDLFSKVLTQNLGSDLIPHASGPSTLTISNTNNGDDLTNLGIYAQTVYNNLLQELLTNGVITYDAATGNVMNIDLQKFKEYRNSPEFQDFINRNARYQSVE